MELEGTDVVTGQPDVVVRDELVVRTDEVVS